MLIKNKRGQIAIFVVLVFQFLFILFAMTINIALVVHDKINFQNSLDLATYYGAKQQAEVLSAMAHINYQMRQNWKLLAWRYRILGTLLQDKGRSPHSPPDYWCPQNDGSRPPGDPPPPKYSCTSNDCNIAECRGACQQAQAILPYGNNYCDLQYFVCISNNLWKRGVERSGQNLCVKHGVRIPAIDDLVVVPGADYLFPPVMTLAQDITRGLQRDASESCPLEGALNWLMTQLFLTHFRLDQKDRKTMLREIYKKSLQEGKDLDGESIFEGAKRVFFKNLTEANKKNIQAEDPNDYGLEEFNSFKGKAFKDVFGYLNVSPVLRYVEFGRNIPGETVCATTLYPHYNTNGDYDNHWTTMKSLFNPPGPGSIPHGLYSFLGPSQKKLFSFNHDPLFLVRDEIDNKPIASLTLGFFKKTDQTLYYGLKGKFDYLSKNQIFSLSLSPSILFRASSFAKPFGGRFGPQPDKGDPLIPHHHQPGSPSIPQTGSVSSTFLQPNYSRWPGDRWGLIDWILHYEHSNPQFLKKISGTAFYYIEDFLHLIFYDSFDDPLARPNLPEPDLKKNFTRMMELMAVYPDVFDLSHYSIASNYMKTYFPRICKLIREGGGDCQNTARNKISGTPPDSPAYIRGDFGWPETDYYMDRNRDKTSDNVDISVAPYFLKANLNNPNDPKIDFGEITHFTRNPQRPIRPLTNLTKGEIFYSWLAQKLPDYLLSSWAPTEERDRYFIYGFPEKKFLQCKNPAITDKPVPSSCAVGGRSDYSVKLISCETVHDLSPKPPNLSEYCSP